MNDCMNNPSTLSRLKVWAPLLPGDTIDLVAPSSMPDEAAIPSLIKMIENAGFKASTKYAPLHEELGYANTIEVRAESFYKAMKDPDSKMVWAIRGGAGSTRLWPLLSSQPVPAIAKPLVGFSDTTGLFSFINQAWGFPALHGVLAEYNKEVAELFGSTLANKDQSIQSVIDIVTGKTLSLSYDLTGVNPAAKALECLDDVCVFGGNSSLVEAALGGPFATRGQDFILAIESIGATVHQLERSFDSYVWGFDMLSQASQAKAIIIGQTLVSESRSNTKSEQATYDKAMSRLGDLLPHIPVFSAPVFGHGYINQPLILGSSASIKKAKDKISLTMANPAATVSL